MPVQINELIIRATVDPERQESQQILKPSTPPSSQIPDVTMITEIVEEILKAKKER